eukprot:11753655-Heterocapsa_arctica.AAC.1
MARRAKNCSGDPCSCLCRECLVHLLLKDLPSRDSSSRPGALPFDARSYATCLQKSFVATAWYEL